MSNNILHINASARSETSVSRKNSAHIVQSLGGDAVVTRDLGNDIPFLNEDWVTATFMPAEARSETQSAALTFSDTLVQELQDADTIVIGLPLYNFGIPANLKAWIDQVARAGVTFTYTDTGPKGLLEGKKVIITIASGGVPIGSEMDFASSYLKVALGFLGISDVTILDNDQAEAYGQAA